MAEKVFNISGVPNGVLRHLNANEQKYGMVTFPRIINACFFELDLVKRGKSQKFKDENQAVIIDFAKRMCNKADHKNWLWEYQKYLQSPTDE